MIACGWCGAATEARPCSVCGHDPELAYVQRGRVPTLLDDRSRHVQRLAEARKRLTSAGRVVTVDRLAEELGVDARTVRRWQAVSAK